MNNLTKEIQHCWDIAEKEIKTSFKKGMKAITLAEILTDYYSDYGFSIPEQLILRKKEIFACAAENGVVYAQKALDDGDYATATNALEYAQQYAHKSGITLPHVSALLYDAGLLGFSEEIGKACNALYTGDLSELSRWIWHLEEASVYARKVGFDPVPLMKDMIKEDFPQISEKLLNMAEEAISKEQPAEGILDRIRFYARSIGEHVPARVAELHGKAKSQEDIGRIN